MRNKRTQEEVIFAPVPVDLLRACAKVKSGELRETLQDILIELSKQNKKINGEWWWYDEGFYPLTGAADRLGKDSHTISRRLDRLVTKNILTKSKRIKGYEGEDKKYFHSTTHIKLEPISKWKQPAGQ